jgi:hypothetical protein
VLEKPEIQAGIVRAATKYQTVLHMQYLQLDGNFGAAMLWVLTCVIFPEQKVPDQQVLDGEHNFPMQWRCYSIIVVHTTNGAYQNESETWCSSCCWWRWRGHRQ